MSSLQDSNSSQGTKPGSRQAFDAVQPASALTTATADGYCQFQDEINTTDQDLRELRKHTDGEAGPEDHYFEEGSLRFGLFNNDFEDEPQGPKDRRTQDVQNINFFGHEGAEDKDCELRSQKDCSSEDEEARSAGAGRSGP